ncbi:MAG TPA: response regulator transcription factor [Bryobacteraceae bacterium]|jgi:two-component system alkaline phosphatase synthesis response regulator PhoP|nr:response regulator transcription factor [Bryobacteraceae bacterium]
MKNESESRARILLVEDEAGLVMTLTDRLQNEGYTVESARDGESGLERACSEPFDLIILDVMLPRKSGFDVCRKLRHSGIQTPVLMLTARSQVVDKVVGLQIGADDYVTKPFDMMELLARLEALRRRAPRAAAVVAGVHQFGSVHVDLRSAEVTRQGRPVALTAREFQLLRYLIEHRGEILSRDQLLADVWGYEAMPSTRTVDVHMAWLRQKLEENPRFPEFFLTLRGLGYKFAG